MNIGNEHNMKCMSSVYIHTHRTNLSTLAFHSLSLSLCRSPALTSSLGFNSTHALQPNHKNVCILLKVSEWILRAFYVPHKFCENDVNSRQFKARHHLFRTVPATNFHYSSEFYLLFHVNVITCMFDCERWSQSKWITGQK